MVDHQNPRPALGDQFLPFDFIQFEQQGKPDVLDEEAAEAPACIPPAMIVPVCWYSFLF
jgi:hypothetical protein